MDNADDGESGGNLCPSATGKTMATRSTTTLPEHYERHFGRIARGWSDDKRTHGIQVACFEAQPEPGVRTFATLGLSSSKVALSEKTRTRQELLLSANDNFAVDAVAALVLSLAEHVLERGQAFLRGEVVGPGAPVIAGSTLTAIYVANPSPFDKSLTQFASDSPPTVFAYLIPITNTEAELVRTCGWSWFEDQLERQDPDIWDLARIEKVERST